MVPALTLHENPGWEIFPRSTPIGVRNNPDTMQYNFHLYGGLKTTDGTDVARYFFIPHQQKAY